ncbi:MAG: peptidase M14, partial [Rubricoccaceae bacterium]|nr:peptidase M14 [Rubricoccaceae bacterium]
RDVVNEAGVEGYVVAADHYPQRAAALAELLDRHRIEVFELAETFEQDGRVFTAGESFVVPLDQPQARLIKAMFEEVTTFEDSLFYDVSAWTFPHAFGVDYAARPSLSGLVGVRWVPDVIGNLIGGRATYAYVIPWGRYTLPRALYRLQEAGVVVRVSFEPFEADAGGIRRSFERGTLIVPVQQDGVGAETVHQLISDVVVADGIDVYAASTGLTPTGVDFGSPSIPVVEKPRVAILAGSGTSSYDVGELWHLLGEKMQIPVSLVELDRLDDVDLTRYSTVVTGSVFRVEESDQNALLEWVREGGTLIATGSGAGWAARNEFLEVELAEADEDSTRIPYADQNEVRGAQQIGGAIFEIDLDTTHPLAFGYSNRVPVFKTNTLFFEGITPDGYDVGVYQDEPLLSGYVSEENLDTLRGKSALLASRLGGGSVVLMDFDPAFRAFWYGTDGLLLNAVFFGGMF